MISGSGRMRIAVLLGAALLVLFSAFSVYATEAGSHAGATEEVQVETHVGDKDLEAHGGAHQGATPGQIRDFILRCINFGILVVLLVVLLRKPIGNAMRSRTEGIADELDELNQRREEAAKELAEMERRLADAAGEQEAILAEFRAQGERERERIIDGAKAMGERIKQQAQFTIEQETNQAKASLRREIADLSASVAEDLLKQKMTADDQARLVSEYLTKVEQEVQ